MGELNTGAVPRHGSPVSLNDIQIDGVAAGLRVSGSGPGATLAAFVVQGAVEATSAALRGRRSGSSCLLHTLTLIDRQTQIEAAIQD